MIVLMGRISPVILGMIGNKSVLNEYPCTLYDDNVLYNTLEFVKNGFVPDQPQNNTI